MANGGDGCSHTGSGLRWRRQHAVAALLLYRNFLRHSMSVPVLSTPLLPRLGYFQLNPSILEVGLPSSPLHTPHAGLVPGHAGTLHAESPTRGVGEGGVRGAPGAVGRQGNSLPAGVLAAAALPHVQVAAAALRGAKHKRRDRQQQRTRLEGTSTFPDRLWAEKNSRLGAERASTAAPNPGIRSAPECSR